MEGLGDAGTTADGAIAPRPLSRHAWLEQCLLPAATSNVVISTIAVILRRAHATQKYLAKQAF